MNLLYWLKLILSAKGKIIMNLRLLVVAACAVPLLTGCVVAVSDGEVDSHWASSNTSSWEKQHENNRNKIANLQLSQTYQTVLNTLGTPNFSEFVTKNAENYQVLFYATHSIHSDGKMTKDECTPLVFKNGQLVGWGDAAYNPLL